MACFSVQLCSYSVLVFVHFFDVPVDQYCCVIGFFSESRVTQERFKNIELGLKMQRKLYLINNTFMDFL